MMNKDRVKSYFEESAKNFDNIYDNRGSLLDKLVNKVFRKSLYERAALTVKKCGDVQNKTILDIGCGSGRISLALAKKGAKVTGIDFSENMILVAHDYLKALGLNLDVQFLCGDFMQHFSGNEQFDITLALGVFDYIKDPLPLLKKMKDITKGGMIASFPAEFPIRNQIRKLWLCIKNCPVYFYSPQRVISLYEQVGIKKYEIIKLPLNARIPNGYLVEAKL